MEAPLLVVTGGIAAGKSTVASIMAEKGGTLVDADILAHEALRDPGFIGKLEEEFGEDVMNGSGRVSRLRLAGIVFSDQERLDRFNAIIKPYVKRIAEERLRSLARSARYIVLDALLFLQYKFSLEADLVVLVDASEQTRIDRLMRRDGFSREEALMRMDRQRNLYEDWAGVDIRIDTDRPLEEVRETAARIRDEFLAEHLENEG